MLLRDLGACTILTCASSLLAEFLRTTTGDAQQSARPKRRKPDSEVARSIGERFLALPAARALGEALALRIRSGEKKGRDTPRRRLCSEFLLFPPRRPEAVMN
ncbi:hypothetical protein MRX96_059750 [Rhipicephalus microplus]